MIDEKRLADFSAEIEQSAQVSPSRTAIWYRDIIESMKALYRVVHAAEAVLPYVDGRAINLQTGELLLTELEVALLPFRLAPADEE